MEAKTKSLILSIFVILSYTLQAQEKPNKYTQMGLDYNRDQFVIIKKKENFRTGCDTAQMKLTILSTKFEANGGESAYGNTNFAKKQKKIDLVQATNVGVVGCGQKAVYILTGNGWALNSVDEKK